MPRLAHAVLPALVATLIAVALLVMPTSASAESPSSSTAWTHADAQRYISSYFSYIWDESYVAYGPMGVASGPLEVNRRYTRTVDPQTGEAQLTWSEGLFGYVVPGSRGRVAPIDTSLRRVTGGFSPRGVGYRLRLPARFGDGVVWGDEASGSPVVTLVPVRSRALRAGKVVGPKLDKVLYPDVWPASDVVMTATGTGVKDHIIVRNLERAPDAYSFIVRRPAGAKTEVAADGSVAVALAGGEAIALLEAPRAQDAKGQGVDIWYTSTDRGTYDLLTMHYSVKPRLVGVKWITYEAPLDLDPALYTDEINPGVDAWADTSGHTGTIADTTGGLRVQLSKRTFAYPNEAFAQWRIGRPPAGASWYSLAGDINVRVGANQRYALSSGGVNKYVRVGGSDPEFSTNHFTFTAPNDESYFVSRIDMTAVASTAFDYYGTLSNLARTFVDNVDPTQPTIGANFGFIAPSTFQASTSFSDAESGCGGGTIYVINEAGSTIRSQGFAGCAATLTFSGVPEGSYTLLSEVHDRATRTNWNSTSLYVYPAPDVWVESPLDYDYAHSSVLVSGGVGPDNPFFSGYEISLDGLLTATLPATESFAYALNTSGASEGEHTVTVAARDIAGAASTWDVPIIVDHSAPEVDIVDPTQGQYVSGTITIAVDAEDTVSEVTSVELLVDGAIIATRTGDQAYEADLDTLALTTGTHTITARATNPLGLTRTSAPVTIVVDNVAPSATILAPAQGAAIDGTASFSISVFDNFEIADAQLNLYNSRNFQIPLGSASTAGTYAYSLDTTQIQNGDYALELVAFDKAGNQTITEHQITVANPHYVLGHESWLSSSDVGPVSVGHATGNLHITSTDTEIPALGTTLQLQRSYNHQDPRVGSFGRGWVASFERSISIGVDQVATYRDADGTLHAFYPTDTGYERATGLDADLTHLDSGGYELRHLNGNVETYDASGRLLKDTTRTGQAITLRRDANGNVYELADDSGLTIRIERNLDGLTTATIDPAGRRTQYTYGSDGSLATVTNPLGATSSFGYGSTGWLVTQTDALDYTTTIQYANGRVARVTNAADTATDFIYATDSVSVQTATRTTTYTLDQLGRAISTALADGSIQERAYDDAGDLTEFVNGNGDRQTFTYDETGNQTAETDFEGHTTRYANHDPFGAPRLVTNPLGEITRYSYDAEGNLIKTIKPSGGEITATYDEAGNKLTEADALGNATTMSYDAHGRLVRSAAPGNAITSYELDLAGQVLTQTAPNSGQTTYTYDAAGNQTSTTDPEGHTTTRQYDALGRVIAETNGAGGTTTTTYNALGDPIRVTNPAGGVQTTTYNAHREATARTDENGAITRYAYDAASNLITETDPLGDETSFEVDGAGNVVSETTPDGNTIEYVYDADGRVIQTINPDGTSTETTYRADGSIETVIDEDGGITRYAYNPDGDQTSITDPLGNATQTQLNANGDTIAEIDELGNRTSLELNEQGVPVRSTDTDGHQVQTVVDVMGNVTASTDANGHTTSYGYDKLGQLEKITDPLGGIYAYTYNANGEITSETDELGRATIYAYSPTAELISATDPAGGIDRFTYDAAGNVVTDTDADGNTTIYQYDQAGQITASVDGEGQTTRYTYDADGNLATETDPAGQTTTYGFDANGRLETVRDPGGETTSYSYSGAGDLTAITAPGGETTTYAYDAAHRVSSQTSSLEGLTTYTYTPRGELNTATDAAGTTTYAYTSLGQLASITLPDGTRTSYTYDAAGNLLTITEPSGTTTYTYDAANRLDSTTTADGTVIGLTYNLAGELTAQTIDEQTTTYTYTSAGLLASQTDHAGTTHFTYSAAGKLTSISRPNGITTTFTYDDAGQLRSIADSDGDSHTYELDPAGRITTTRATDGTSAYAYDARGQLTSWTHNGVSTLYTYDRRGNLLRIDRNLSSVDQGDVPPGIQTHIETCLATSFTDCPNPNILDTLQCLTATQPTCDPTKLEGVEALVARYFANYAVPVRTYTYDAHSRLTSLTDEIAHSTDTFEYDTRGNQTRAGNAIRTFDSQNRLTSVVADGEAVSYGYDASGLRTSRTDNGTTTRYTYDPQGRLVKLVTPGEATIRFAHAADSLHSITIGNDSYFYHFNSRGDTTRLTSRSGETVARYTYTPWGETTATGDQVLIDANPFTYNGADRVQYDATLGLYWMGARHFDPRQSRFLQTDPEISADDRADAPYLYAGNDPVNHADPDGQTLRRSTSAPRRIVQPRPRVYIANRQVSRPTAIPHRRQAVRSYRQTQPRNRPVRRSSHRNTALRPGLAPAVPEALEVTYTNDVVRLRTVKRGVERRPDRPIPSCTGTNKIVPYSGVQRMTVSSTVNCTAGATGGWVAVCSWIATQAPRSWLEIRKLCDPLDGVHSIVGEESRAAITQRGPISHNWCMIGVAAYKWGIDGKTGEELDRDMFRAEVYRNGRPISPLTPCPPYQNAVNAAKEQWGWS